MVGLPSEWAEKASPGSTNPGVCRVDQQRSDYELCGCTVEQRPCTSVESRENDCRYACVIRSAGYFRVR